jgi:hypothetical protein
MMQSVSHVDGTSEADSDPVRPSSLAALRQHRDARADAARSSRSACTSASLANSTSLLTAEDIGAREAANVVMVLRPACGRAAQREARSSISSSSRWGVEEHESFFSRAPARAFNEGQGQRENGLGRAWQVYY